MCNSADTPIVALSGHRELELTTEFHKYGEMSKELKVWSTGRYYSSTLMDSLILKLILYGIIQKKKVIVLIYANEYWNHFLAQHAILTSKISCLLISVGSDFIAALSLK